MRSKLIQDGLAKLRNLRRFRMNRRRAGIGLAVLFVLVGAILAWPRQHNYFRPPVGGSVFKELSFKALHDPPLKGSKPPAFAPMADKIIIQEGATPMDFVLAAEPIIMPSLRYDAVLQNNPGEHRIQLSSGEFVTAVALGTMHTVGVEPADRRYRFANPETGEFYSLEEFGDLVQADLESEHGWIHLQPGKLYHGGVFQGPFGTFQNGEESIPPDTFHPFHALNSSRPLGVDDQVFTHYDTYRWHDGPVEFYWDIGSGPVTQKSMTASPGSEVDLGTCKVRVLAHVPGQYQIRQARTRTGGKFGVSENAYYRGDEGSTIFLVTDSPQLWRFIKCELLDAEGKDIPWSLFSWPMKGQRIAAISTRLPPDDVAEVRLRVPQFIDRVFYRMESVPGIPESNRNLENLFDVRIPYAEVNSDVELCMLISDASQLSFNGDYSSFDVPGYYPKTFKDQTLQQIMQEVDSINQGKPLVVDLDAYSLREVQRPDWVEAVVRWMKSIEARFK